MIRWAALPMGLQALAMLVDELHFHRQRGLPRWERIGHPLDTSSALICYGLTLSLAPTSGNLIWYVLAATFSCLLVTKDELVHARYCSPWEHWLHALLFVIHPIVLGVGALLWFEQERTLLWLSASLTAAFGSYQALYWNVPWTKPLPSRSTTTSTTNLVSVGTPPMTTPSPYCEPSRGSETHG
ncbi:MAG TPA: hypothetical protein VHM70_22440 [Polyangiaceae bacterium]|nr:hypothetical protein [Polyangiaceae bacterium]